MKQRRHDFLWFSVFVASVLLCLASTLYTQRKADAVDAGTIGSHSCIGFHRVAASFISQASPFPEGIDPSSLCLDCHDYQENHHPVNFVPEVVVVEGNELNLIGPLRPGISPSRLMWPFSAGGVIPPWKAVSLKAIFS